MVTNPPNLYRRASISGASSIHSIAHFDSSVNWRQMMWFANLDDSAGRTNVFHDVLCRYSVSRSPACRLHNPSWSTPTRRKPRRLGSADRLASGGIRATASVGESCGRCGRKAPYPWGFSKKSVDSPTTKAKGDVPVAVAGSRRFDSDSSRIPLVDHVVPKCKGVRTHSTTPKTCTTRTILQAPRDGGKWMRNSRPAWNDSPAGSGAGNASGRF